MLHLTRDTPKFIISSCLYKSTVRRAYVSEAIGTGVSVELWGARLAALWRRAGIFFSYCSKIHTQAARSNRSLAYVTRSVEKCSVVYVDRPIEFGLSSLSQRKQWLVAAYYAE